MATLLCGFSPLGGGAAPPEIASSACHRDDYVLELRLWQAQGAVLATVGIVTDRAPACTLETTVRLTIRHRDRAIARGVRGNPAVWRIATPLAPWSQLVHTWSWRNWCHPAQRFVVTAGADGRQTSARVLTPPRCRNRRAASRFVESGSGTKLLPFAGNPIPAHILPLDTPIPVSPALIRVTNAWLVSDGRTLVAVYAGEAGNDPAVGLFGIIRQNLFFGIQTRDIVTVGRTGAVRITQAPEGAAVVTSAQRADIRFSSTTGAQGVLHLASDTVDLLP